MADKPVGWRKDSARHGLAAKGIKTAAMKNVALPKDLTQMTRKQNEEYIDVLSKLPLKERRRRQTQTEGLITKAFQDRDDLKLGNMQHMFDLLMFAVDKREFGGRY